MVEKAFISYEKEAKKKVTLIKENLEKKGIKTNGFFDYSKSIGAGDEIATEISRGIENADCFIIILTNQYFKNVWTKRELSACTKQSVEKRKKILGIIFEELTSIPPLLDSIKLIDCSSDELFKQNLPEIIALMEAQDMGSNLKFRLVEDLFEYSENKYLNGKLNYEKIIIKNLDIYDKAFSLFTSFDGDIVGTTSDNLPLFEKILQYIERFGEANTVLIEGNPGTGKSTFLSVMYYFFKNNFQNTELASIPIYIDLEIYNTFLNEKDAIKQFKDDFLPISVFLQTNNLKPIIILDNFDDFFKNIIQLKRHILDLINNLLDKKIIVGLSTSDGLPISKNRIEYIAKSKIKLNNFSNLEQIYSIIPVFTELFGKQQASDERITKLKSFINKLNLEKIDFFMLQLIYNYLDYELGKLQSLTSLLELVASDKQNNSDDKYFSAISSKIFDFYILSIEVNQDYINNNRAIWDLANSHISFRDFFISKHIINTIINYSKSKENTLLAVFNHVYPFSINNFCKEILNLNHNTQKLVFKGIHDAFDRVTDIGKIHFCYLLGRFEQSYFKDKAKSFLISQFKNKRFENAKTKPTNNDNPFRLFERTLYISLAYLGSVEHSNKYIELLMLDKKYDKVNRGFHLEYYGDISYDLSDENSLNSLDNNECDIENTFNKLIFRLNNALNTNRPHQLFNIELLTLCSLIQHRQSKYQEKYKFEIECLVELLNKIIRRRIIFHTGLNKYLRFLLDRLQSSTKFSEYDIFTKIHSIKDIERSGWNRIDKGRTVLKPETVASHIYGCILIAKFFLPENWDVNENYDDKYSKLQIINILMFHDIGEFKNGDISSDLKNNKDVESERNAIEEISFLTTYESYGKLYDIEEYWNIYENRNNEDINYKVARDIDKLDNILQLLRYYYDLNIKTLDFFDFFMSLKSDLNTTLGVEIFHKMIQPYKEKLYQEYPHILI